MCGNTLKGSMVVLPLLMSIFVLPLKHYRTKSDHDQNDRERRRESADLQTAVTPIIYTCYKWNRKSRITSHFLTMKCWFGNVVANFHVQICFQHKRPATKKTIERQFQIQWRYNQVVKKWPHEVKFTLWNLNAFSPLQQKTALCYRYAHKQRRRRECRAMLALPPLRFEH